MSCRKISFINCKGGVGKTSICVNVAALLAHQHKKRVLVVDCDAQSNSSIWLLGLPEWLRTICNSPSKTVYAPFLDSTRALPLQDSVIKSPIKDQGITFCKTLDLIPASYHWMDFDHEYQDKKISPYYITFYQQITALGKDYDFVLFDCPPALGRASKCAIFASDEFYVPTSLDLISGVGIAALTSRLSIFYETSKDHKKTIKHYEDAVCSGVIYNRVPTVGALVKARHNIQSFAVKNKESHPHIYAKNFRVLETEIRSYAAAAAGPIDSSVPISVLDPTHNVSRDYAAVASEILTFKPKR